METEQQTVLWDMSFSFSSETGIPGTMQILSINTLTPSAVHDLMMWNYNNKNHETMTRLWKFLINNNRKG